MLFLVILRVASLLIQIASIPSNDEFERVEFPLQKYIAPAYPVDALKLVKVSLYKVTLPSMYKVPPLPHGVETSSKLELMIRASFIFSTYIAPPR